MKIQDRIKSLEGVTDAHWESQSNRLVVYYSNVPLDTMKIRVSGAIGEAHLQEAVDKITLISTGVTSQQAKG